MLPNDSQSLGKRLAGNSPSYSDLLSTCYGSHRELALARVLIHYFCPRLITAGLHVHEAA